LCLCTDVHQVTVATGVKYVTTCARLQTLVWCLAALAGLTPTTCLPAPVPQVNKQGFDLNLIFRETCKKRPSWLGPKRCLVLSTRPFFFFFFLLTRPNSTC
jgi:hypothetical protein